MLLCVLCATWTDTLSTNLVFYISEAAHSHDNRLQEGDAGVWHLITWQVLEGTSSLLLRR